MSQAPSPFKTSWIHSVQKSHDICHIIDRFFWAPMASVSVVGALSIEKFALAAST